MPLIPDNNNNDNNMETVKFSPYVIKTLEKIQKRMRTKIGDIHTLPYTALLGKNNKGVISNLSPLTKGGNKIISYEQNGCALMPKINTVTITKAALKLIKQNLTVCGIVRVHRYIGHIKSLENIDVGYTSKKNV